MHRAIEEIREKTSIAAALTEKWMLKHIHEEEIFARKIADPVRYYKWPLALVFRDKKEEAAQLLNWINRECLDDNGDYVSNRSGFHQEFHLYSTLWLVLAAIYLEENALVEKLLSFILEYFNHQTGGLATFPAKTSHITEDMVTTAF